ncbi:uncharacterized protein LOC132914147 [Bombus pascuorum]|uniref:uncharacterized protein LOC132914147 n=1 Tax=Bombus pascuorum TaxID=65598 RepID=UPI00298DFC77|nr:uncharacterized protein LOC132914147 [Bombus pascuorum]
MSAVYCPPRHSISKEDFDNLGNRFIAGGDYNTKHTQWGSRLITVRDHSPVIAIINSTITENLPNGFIHNQLTNWQLFREFFNHTTASIRLKTNEDIEVAAEYLNTSIVNAIRSSTPIKSFNNKHEYPHYILKKNHRKTQT